MTKRWTRKRDLALPLGGERAEVWECQDGNGPVASYPMQVRLGKPFDVLRMKRRSVEEFREWASHTRHMADKLYAADVRRRHVDACPCCSETTAEAETFCTIHDVTYLRCAICAHVFIGNQPAADVLNQTFADAAGHTQDYLSPEHLEQRLREIVQPKLDWVRSTYRRHVGRDVCSIVDVGAGAGHFVACCQRAGLHAEGYEISKAALLFAKEAFAIDLKHEDFLASLESRQCDVVTFWGLLEYTPEPARFVAAARRHLADPGGMLILEVPRADALGAAIQAQSPHSVWRHLVPTSHVNVYSDASVATLLHGNGFRPIAAWYFGMDFYELLCQFAVVLDDDRLLTQLGPLVGPMQAWVDAAEFSDDLIVAAVPV